MRSSLSTIILGAFLAAPAFAACTANIHDNTVNIPNASIQLNTTANVSSVKPGDGVPIQIKADNVFLVSPGTTPPPAHVNDAGYFQIYFDDDTSTPVLITADISVTVTVPMGTKDGDHKFVCRLHKTDGTATSVRSELHVTVKS
jgi:hypothetical protein